MSDINTIRVQQYGSVLRHLVQQMGSRLRNTVMVKDGVVGKRTSEDQVGTFTAAQKEARHADTPIMNVDVRRRWAIMADYEIATLHDKEDQLKEQIDPTSPFAISMGYGLGRKIDDVLIAAATAAAYTGEEGSSTTSFDTANQQIASGGTGLTISKLEDTLEIMEENDLPDPAEDPRYFIFAAKQMRELLNSTEVKSADYNTVKALAMGKIDTFMGFKFIRSQRLAYSGGVRTCLAYSKSGLMLAIGKDMSTRIDERVDKGYSKQVYASMSIGATRMEETKVVSVLCAEA